MDKDLLRPCEVTVEYKGGKAVHKGWFHCWEHYSEVVGESPIEGWSLCWSNLFCSWHC